MKKFFLSMVAAGMALCASAQSVTPAPGIINMGDNPGGVGTITVNGDWRPNRACPDLATLSHNGLVIKMVPASNVPNVYCLDGFTKVDHGNTIIEFFQNVTSEASEFGKFRVVIPEGFLIDNETGEPSPLIVRDYIINTVKGKFSPALGSNVEKIETIYITFPEETTIVSANAAKPYFDTPELIPTGEVDEDGEPVYESVLVYPSEITFTGRVAVLKFPTITTPGRNTLEIPAGTFTIKSSLINGNAAEYKNELFGGSFYIADDNMEYTLTPSKGTYTDGIPATVVATEYDFGTYATPRYGDLYAYFVLNNRETDDTFGATRGAQVVRVDDEGNETKVTTLNVKRIDGHHLALVDIMSEGKTPSTLALAPGKYRVHFPKNYLYVGYTALSEFSIGDFTIEPAAVKNYTITPSTTAKLDEIKEIVLTYEEGTTLSWQGGQYANITNELGNASYILEGEPRNNELVFSLPAAITIPGQWTLTVPTGALKVNNVEAVISETFTIAALEKLPVEVNIPNGEETTVVLEEDEELGQQVLKIATRAQGDFATIVFDIPAGYDEMLYMSYSSGEGSLKTTTEDLIAAGFQKGNTIDVPAGTTNQVYAIAFAKNGIVDDNTMYPTYITVDYPVAVGEIISDENVEVYSITGIRVSFDGNIANLPAGLYIINGKKVIIK